jgi:chorismate dehydratase
VTIRIGHIEYANCTPIFTALRETYDCADYHFINGVPARLNEMMRQGAIDVCPASSIEYGKSPEKYLLLPDISISSDGAVKSVLLFSRVPLADLHNQSIALTVESDTSINLLKIILGKQYGFSNLFERSSLPLQEALNKYSAMLLIGDAALRESGHAGGLFVYDLGELWFEFTGLPFVFALWLVTRDAALHNGGEVQALVVRLLAAKRRAYDTYESIADQSREREWLGRDALVEYWRTISYDLTPRHLQGVATFFRYAKELQILKTEPEIRIFG